MSISKEQRIEIEDALRAAFNEPALRRMLQDQLETNLDTIVQTANLDLNDIITSLVNKYAAQERIEDLLTAAVTERPGNRKLRDISVRHGISPATTAKPYLRPKIIGVLVSVGVFLTAVLAALDDFDGALNAIDKLSTYIVGMPTPTVTPPPTEVSTPTITPILVYTGVVLDFRGTPVPGLDIHANGKLSADTTHDGTYDLPSYIFGIVGETRLKIMHGDEELWVTDLKQPAQGNDLDTITLPEPTATPTPIDTPTNTPEPTQIPSDTPTNTPEPTQTPTDTSTNTPEPIQTPTDTPTNTPEPTQTPTNTPTNTPEPTQIPTDTPEPTSTNTPSPQPTATHTSTSQATATPSPKPTITPTNTPAPANTPTNTPPPPATAIPAPTPTSAPTNPPETVSQGFKLLAPDDKASISGGVTFKWETSLALADNQGFEVVLWEVGNNPEINGFGMHDPITQQETYVDLPDLTFDTPSDNLQLKAGTTYQWGVMLVQPDPYVRLRLLGEKRTFTYSPDKGPGENPNPP